MLTPTGTEPDWGPAAPPAARWTPGGGGTARAGKVRLVGTPKAKPGALRKGLRVRVAVPAAGRLTARLSAGGKVIASASGKATGKSTVTLRLSKVAKNARTKRLKLVVAFSGSDGSSSRVSKKL